MAEDAHYEGALLEEIRDEVRALHEAFRGLADIPGDVRQLREDMVEVRADIKVIKTVVSQHSLDIRELRAAL